VDTNLAPKSEVRLLDGNGAAAHAVRLCKPDVIAGYPITPQTALLEQLSQFCADGLLDAEMVEVEGENSAMSVLIGAAASGGRTFTSTSAPGLAFMYDAYFFAAGQRLPIVMAIATREMTPPATVVSGEQDIVMQKDTGWIQIHVENCQEILDTIIMAYRLAEDLEILLPVNVCYDGFYLSYLSEGIEVPSQKDVDAFLAPLSENNRPRFGSDPPLSFGVFLPPKIVVEHRYKHCAALQRAKEKIDEIDGEFQKIFGRGYGGQIEEYKTEEAEIVLVTMGSCSGTAKVVVDNRRDEGQKIGLIKVRTFSPFPSERMLRALKGKKAIGVIDRSVCFGKGRGHLFVELKLALSDSKVSVPVLDFIGGLSGLDITIEHMERAVDSTFRAAEGLHQKEVTWMVPEQ
jgi:pyruvate/2-oxoacid:ferredoxin oxidoreductase alpha subunit